MDQFPEMTGAISMGAVILGILIGLLNCFFGYRLFKVILGIWGFIVGVGIGAGIALSVSGELWIVILAGLLGGVVGAVLFVLLYFVGIFILGAGLGVLLGGAIVSAISLGSELQWVIVIVLAIIGGVVAIIVQKFMIVLSTSFGGAAAAVSGVYSLAGGQILSTPTTLSIDQLSTSTLALNWVLLLVWLLLGIAGMIVQFAVTAKEKEESLPPPPPPRPSPPPYAPVQPA